ncbi:MAG: phage tail protein [Quinella sp. 1Q5]|nr:phage tail protein [Quinella sp. 1Q5]
MIDIYNASLADILPESLKADKQFVAIANALDPLLKKFARNTRLAMHIPRLDEITGTLLDVLAEQFHVDVYDSVNLDDFQKRNLIRQSIALHRYKGTAWAVEAVAEQFFGSPIVEELEGFLFRIKTKEYIAAPEAFATFRRMIMDAKPVRSWFMGVDLDLSPPPTTLRIAKPIVADGRVNIDFRRPSGSKVLVRLGSPIIVSGSVTIFPRS